MTSAYTLRPAPPGRLLGLSAAELRWQYPDPRVRIGRGTYGGPTLIVYSHHPDDRIEIGHYCSISEGSTLIAGGQHNAAAATTFPFDWYYAHDSALPPVKGAAHVHRGPVIVGSDVWIGRGATVLSGANVGHGAVVGASAVVAGKVPPYSIVVGNPARVIRKRFEQATIDRLLVLRWWDWSPAVVKKYQPLLQSDPADLLAAVDRLPPGELAGYYGPPATDDRPTFDPPPRPTFAKRAAKAVARRLLPGRVYDALRGGTP